MNNRIALAFLPVAALVSGAATPVFARDESHADLMKQGHQKNSVIFIEKYPDGITKDDRTMSKVEGV